MTGWIASEYGLRPYPFYIGIGMAAAGLLLSLIFIKDTAPWVHQEANETKYQKSSQNLFWKTSWKYTNLFAITQAGLTTNLTDGLAWGAFPLFLTAAGLDLYHVGTVTGIYPAFWGIFQIATGKLSDYTGRKRMIVAGMLIQSISLLVFPLLDSFYAFVLAAAFLGLGTAMVYPTFLASVADLVHPHDRAESVGTFRLWRDLGYAFGALFAGIIADYFNLATAILFTGTLTLFSTLYILIRMDKLDQPVKTH